MGLAKHGITSRGARRLGATVQQGAASGHCTGGSAVFARSQLMMTVASFRSRQCPGPTGHYCGMCASCTGTSALDGKSAALADSC